MTDSLNSTKKIFIADLKAKDQVSSEFLVKYMALMEGRDGRSYINLVLSDSSGEIEARVWSDANRISQLFKKGEIVTVKGKVNIYQGRKQLIVNEIYSYEHPEHLDMKLFYPSSEQKPDEMYQQILDIVAELDDVYLKALLEGILIDPEISRRLKIWPAGKSIHHAYQSGLLEHILSCTKLALYLSHYYRVNKNFMVAGAVLHDLCKIYELSSGPMVDYTEEGKLVGHLVKSLELVDRFSYRITHFPHSTKVHLKHILISHHGEYEFGSPKTPMTKEAYLLHLIDLLDSKMGAFDQIMKSDSNVGHWSGFIKHLDRVLYKESLPSHTDWIKEDEFEKEGEEGEI